MKSNIFNINNFIKILIVFFFLFFFIIPLVKLFMHFGNEGFDAIRAENIRKALFNTIFVGVISAFLSVTIGLSLAYILLNVRTKMKTLFSIIFMLPMLVPTLTHGSGLILLFGNNGIVNRFFGLKTQIYGFWGCVFGFVLYTFPTAFIMFLNILKYEDKRQYEVADVLGVSKLRQLGGITLPYVFKSFTSILSAIFALIITDYGIPLMVGGQFKTLALMMYSDVIGLSKSTGSSISILLLVIAFSALVIELKNQTKPEAFNAKYNLNRYIENKTVKWLSRFFLTIISMFIILYIGIFLIAAFSKAYPYDLSFSLDNFTKVLNGSGIKYLKNSVGSSLGIALIGTCLAYTFAYFTTRSNKKNIIIHVLSICPAAIPGIVLGLSYVLNFKGSFIYGTILIIIIINIVHFFSPVYLLAYNALIKINKNIEDVAQVFGISKLKAFKDIIFPTTFITILDMFSYFFIYSMITISAVSFLSNVNIKPISLMIIQYDNTQHLGNVAVVALVILAINIFQKAIIGLVKKYSKIYN